MKMFASTLQTSLRALAFVASLFLAAVAGAAPFTPGNIAVVRVGDGAAALSSASALVFIHEYTPAGVLVQIIPIPATAATALTMAGSSTSEGALMRSPDGKLLSFAGYKAVAGTANIPAMTAVANPREIGTLDTAGTFAIPASTTTQFSAQNIRSGAADGLNNYWGSGSGSGTYYFGLTAVPATVQNAILNTRVNNIQNGNLYLSTSSGTIGIYSFAGLPTSASPATLLFATGVGSSPYAFAINPAGTLAYVADDRAAPNGGVQRWNKVAGVWSLAYTHAVGAVGARGVVVDWTGGGIPANPIIYATTAETPSANRLVRIVDAGGPSPAATLVTLPVNQVFRGVAFAPQLMLPPPQVFPTPVLPPPDGVYVSPQDWHAIFAATGYAISNVSHRHFLFPSNSVPKPLPGPGQTIIEAFDSTVEADVIQLGQPNVTRVSAPAHVMVSVTGTADPTIFDTEMLQLDIAGGTLGAVMLRESPTRQSLGRTTVVPSGSQYAIGSFFDIFVDMSLDGIVWTPANRAGHVELRRDPTKITPIPAPTPILPPRNDKYVSPRDYHIALANGTVISNISHQFFTQSQFPPLPNGPPTTHQFDSQVDMDLSVNGGPFTRVRAPAAVSVQVRHRASEGGTQVYDTEMLALNIQGGDLPVGVMLRESPSKQSLGGTAITPQTDGTFRIGSFFDIFTEVSLNGGGNWIPAGNPGHVELRCNAPEIAESTPDLPPLDGEYVSPEQFHILTAQGIVISNVSHSRFFPSTPPPQLGGPPQIHSFSSVVDMLVSQNGGQTFTPVSASAQVEVQVTAVQDVGGTRYFDTEMLALNFLNGLPPSVMVRESPSKASLGRTSVRMSNDPTSPPFAISSFFDIFTEVSLDNGANWSPALNGAAEVNLRKRQLQCNLAILCPPGMTVTATTPAGAVVNYPPPTVAGNCGPISVVCSPPSGSPFPIGTTIVNCTATDAQGNSATCTFPVRVRKPKPVFFPGNVLPPPTGVYISPALYHQLYANGIIIRDIRHRRFTGGQPPPSPNDPPQIHQFGSVVEMEQSTDNGLTFQKVSAPANCTVRVSPRPGTTDTFDTEMLALDISGGGLPTTVMIRESPTKASIGETRITPAPGGFLIDSFFDVFTEISLNGGGEWSPAAEPAPVELRRDPSLIPPIKAPTRLLPPPNDLYVSPAQYHILTAQGIVIRDVKHRLFTHSQLPPATGGSQVEIFDSQVDMMLSQDGGQTFRPARAPAAVAVEVEAVGSPGSEFYDTEMLQLDIQGGDLPAGVRLRESPTLPSRGAVTIKTAAIGDPDFDLLRIGSFFDIFVEVSLDGGQTWSPAQGPGHVELQCNAPEAPFPSPFLPPLDGEYVSPDKWHALFAQGIIISNASHRRFTESMPPPPPNATAIHQFGSEVSFDLIRPGSATVRVTAPAAVSVRVTSMQDEGATRFFETEMIALDISGGGLPANVMVRESPSKASLGRTSIRQVGQVPPIWDYISSFFDIFTELSLDGGQTWLPQLSEPADMVLRVPPVTTCPRITIQLLTQTPPQIRICWPADADPACVLQSKRSLDPGAADWQNVTVQPVTIGNEKCVTLPLGNSSTRFFRLCGSCAVVQ